MTAKTILLVDDDPDIHMLLGAHLQEAGYRTASAYDGMSCLAAVRRAPPDLVVLDLGLPAGDGETTLRSLRSLQQLAAVPVLVVSGREEEAWGERTKALGANDYVEKPVDPRQLVERVRALLGDKVPSALPGGNASSGEPVSLSCPHCGGEVGALAAPAVEALLERLRQRA